MFLTLRLAYCCVALAVLLGLGYVWTFFMYVGYVWGVVLLLGCLLNLVLLYGPKGRLVAERSCPELLSLGDDNKVTVKVRNTFNQKVRTIVYDEAPFSFQMRHLKLTADIEPKGEVELPYTVRPVRRGLYVFHTINVFKSVFPHLIIRRFKYDSPFKTKVYPAFAFMHNMEQLSFTNRELEWGSKSIRRIGQSREFEQIREYVKGDDFHSINWKATARKHTLMVNEWQDEKAQTIYAVVDKGRGMQHTFNGLSLLDHSFNSALRLAYLSLQNHDNVGLITFEREVGAFVQAGRSMKQMNRMLSTLYDEVSSFYQSDYFNLYDFCKRKINKRSLLVIYTTFDSLTSVRRQLPHLQQLAKSHVVLVTFFIDKDLEQMANERPNDTLGYVTQMVAQKFGFEQKQIVKELRRYGIYSLLTSPEKLNSDVINRYLEFKSRHIL